MITRRDFCKTMAALSAGAAAQPAQLLVYEKLYEANTPAGRIFGKHDLLQVKSISFGFEGIPRDYAMTVSFFGGDHELLRIPINFRASFHWVAAPDSPMICRTENLRWSVLSQGQKSENAEDFAGTMRAMTTDQIIHTLPLRGSEGSIAKVLKEELRKHRIS